jgi:hypothetical protein
MDNYPKFAERVLANQQSTIDIDSYNSVSTESENEKSYYDLSLGSCIDHFNKYNTRALFIKL